MTTDIDGAQSYNGATDKQEDENDQDCKKNSEEFAASTNLEMFPLNIFRSWHFLILDQKFFSPKKILLLRIIDTATTT